MKDKIKVLICEDLPSLRNKYALFLEKDDEITVVGTAANGYDAAIQSITKRPDVILMDVNMEYREAGIDAARQILASLPDVHIIILTSYAADDLIFKAFETGIENYVLKDEYTEELCQIVKDTYYQRGIKLSPRIYDTLTKEFSRVRSSQDSLLFLLHKLMLLTFSELEILDLLIDGYSRQEICELRTVEMTTIKTQIRGILRKMEMGYTKEMVDTIRQLGLQDFIKDAVQRGK